MNLIFTVLLFVLKVMLETAFSETLKKIALFCWIYWQKKKDS